MFKFISGVAAILLCTASVFADQKIKTAMSPTGDELLYPQITLQDCYGVKIVEWRPTVGWEGTSSPGPETIKIINDTCKLARSQFFHFLNDQNLKWETPQTQFVQHLCLMPARLDRHGDEHRNLNDINNRFASRPRRFNNDGSVQITWGFAEHVTQNIYIRNDVLTDDDYMNSRFVTILAHELYHAMSWHYKVYDNYQEQDKSVQDEKMARKFTKFLNLGE